MTIQVGIVMGSESDLPTMGESKKVLAEFGVESEIKILSAHRTPKLAQEYAQTAISRGLQVIIAGAGMANHLAGSMAAHTLLPVIGVPVDGSALNGLDALLSTVQMPPGIPVACVAVGKAGAKNAGYLAAHILALKDEKIRKKLEEYRKKTEASIVEKNKKL
ncbi:MAG TPA: 5-(carboxyamino)imidazole ribonucleotide mutase [Deltaproteobacteria bacterium]|nr:MAG: 5-(carboxyamino)imidazole ribonucleotide mutase [Deltaproteobacteria bacterium GWA2_45_12]HBF13871.1 5-(carboxyamino)imidazole ribonucleotide mutase [Deltaproteobacteria bacterium]